MNIAVLVAILAIVIAVVHAAKSHSKALAIAKKEYETALSLLESTPANTRYRVSALEKGRAFADLARKQAGSKGVAIFDEVALGNDLHSRCGGGTTVETASAANTKLCPDCAETVVVAARKCRFCGYLFEQSRAVRV